MLIFNWLNKKLISGKNGIIIDNNNYSSYESIQSFIEANDHSLETKVIYYRAFSGESAVEFINTLKYELLSKLGRPKLDLSGSLSETIVAAGLKIIIIDPSYLHPQDTLDELLNQFADCNVSLILVGTCCKMKAAKVLSHPIIKQWDQFILEDEYGTLGKVGTSE